MQQLISGLQHLQHARLEEMEARVKHEGSIENGFRLYRRMFGVLWSDCIGRLPAIIGMPTGSGAVYGLW